MKKNTMMRVASVLLVAVLLSTSVISGTFAKYTTQDSASDVARVAKWGVELQVVGNLYGDTYKETIVKDNASDFTVQSVDKLADLVAPGTENSDGFTFSLKGKPEVAGTVKTTMTIQNVFLKQGTYGLMIPVASGVITAANFDEFTEKLYKRDTSSNFVEASAYEENVDYYTLEDYVEMTNNYYPVIYSLTGNTANTGTSTADSLKAAADKLATAMGLTAQAAAADTSITYTGTKAFTPNTDLASWSVDNEKLTWAWAYGETNSVGNAANENDKADTILGLLENTTDGTVVKLDGTTYKAPVEYTDYCLDTQFSIDITATQAD